MTIDRSFVPEFQTTVQERENKARAVMVAVICFFAALLLILALVAAFKWLKNKQLEQAECREKLGSLSSEPPYLE